MKSLSDSDIERVTRLYRQTGSVHRVGLVMGCVGETVRKFLVAHGVRIDRADWKDEEVEHLRAYYSTHDAFTFSPVELVALFCRPYDAIILKANRIGLVTPKRRGVEQSEFRFFSPADIWKLNPHPRGFKGKKRTDEEKRNQSALSSRLWAESKRDGTRWLTPENLQKASDRMSAQNLANPIRYSRCRGGRRADLGNAYFRSSWEANYARILNCLKARGDIADWKYEAKTFHFVAIKRGVRSYTPDFQIFDSEGERFVEIKGWMDSKSHTRMKRMSKYYPEVKISIVDDVTYRHLSSVWCGLVENWESGRD